MYKRQDVYNRVTFDAISTKVLRLSVQTKAGFSTGTLEWRIFATPGKATENLASIAKPSASYTDVYAGTLTALNDGAKKKELEKTKRKTKYPGKLGDVRELYGYTPWYFNLPDPGYVVNPLLPENTWDYFCLDNVLYHGKVLTIIWDKTGEKYGQGKGLSVWCGDKPIAQSTRLEKITGQLAD